MKITPELVEKVQLLSDREYQVFQHVGLGWLIKEISNNILGWRVSVKTVWTHYGHIIEKLQVNNLHEMRIIAVHFLIWTEQNNIKREPVPKVKWQFRSRITTDSPLCLTNTAQP